MPSADLPTPHDRFFRFVLSQTALARSLIESVLPADAVATMQLDALRVENATYVDAALRERHCDLLMTAPLARSETADMSQLSEEVLVYVLFEHKSTPDPLTALQLLGYIVRIWEQRQREGQPICPLIPLVIYHGERPWAAPRSIAELLPAPPALQCYQVKLEIPLFDLSQTPDDQLAADPLLRAAMQLLKYSRHRRLGQLLRNILGLFISAIHLPDQIDPWIQAIGAYVMATNNEIGADEFRAALATAAEEILGTQIEPGSLAERLLRQGREEGREEGRMEGRAEGREEGRAEGLRRGELMGRLQLLSELLGEPCSPNLGSMSLDDLRTIEQELQLRLTQRRNRSTE